MARQRPLVRIDGLDELRDAIGRIDGQVRKGIRRAVEQAAQAVVDDAESRAPVRTGVLKVSIDSQIDADGMAAGVGFDDDGFYGKFVEFGTSKQSAQPMLTPAAEAERQRFPQRVITEVRRELGV